MAEDKIKHECTPSCKDLTCSNSGKIVYQKVTTTTITRFGADAPTREEVQDALLMYNLTQGNVDSLTGEITAITPTARNVVKNVEKTSSEQENEEDRDNLQTSDGSNDHLIKKRDVKGDHICSTEICSSKYNKAEACITNKTIPTTPENLSRVTCNKNTCPTKTKSLLKDYDKTEPTELISDKNDGEENEDGDRNESLRKLKTCIEGMTTEDIMALTKSLQLQIQKEEDTTISRSVKVSMSAQEQQEYIKYIDKKMKEMSHSTGSYVGPPTNNFTRSNFVFDSTCCSQPSNVIGSQCGKANYRTQGTISQDYLSNNYQSSQQSLHQNLSTNYKLPKIETSSQSYKSSQQPLPFFQHLSTNYELPRTRKLMKQQSEEDCVCGEKVLPTLTISNTNRNPSPTVSPIKSYETKTVTKTSSGGTIVKKINTSTIVTSTPAQRY